MLTPVECKKYGNQWALATSRFPNFSMHENLLESFKTHTHKNPTKVVIQ